MREIKYRGMEINGSWHYGLLAHTESKGVCSDKGWFICNKAGSPFAYHIRPETIGQYTGLKDSKGVDIYEGDIVYACDIERLGSFNIPDNCIGKELYRNEWTGVVEYQDGNFAIKGDSIPICKWSKDYGLGQDEDHYIEVIGNIHQDKELLNDH